MWLGGLLQGVSVVLAGSSTSQTFLVGWYNLHAFISLYNESKGDRKADHLENCQYLVQSSRWLALLSSQVLYIVSSRIYIQVYHSMVFYIECYVRLLLTRYMYYNVPCIIYSHSSMEVVVPCPRVSSNGLSNTLHPLHGANPSITTHTLIYTHTSLSIHAIWHIYVQFHCILFLFSCLENLFLF